MLFTYTDLRLDSLSSAIGVDFISKVDGIPKLLERVDALLPPTLPNDGATLSQAPQERTPVHALFSDYDSRNRDSLYSYFEDSEMADTYRITPQGPEFMVSQNAGVTVGVYNTEQEAQVAVEAHMRLHHIDRRSAHDWIREASD
jgi:hypothetical protein